MQVGGLLRAGMMALLSAVMTAGPVAAQSIPMPFSDDLDTRQLSVVVTKGRTSMKGLPGSLRKARAQMHAKQDVALNDLRRLADYGDGVAAQRYVRALIAQGAQVTQASDVAYYAAIAVGTGRVWTLPDMIEAMTHLDRASEPRKRIRKYIQVLYAHAWAGNTLALQAVVDFNGDDRLFGTLSDKTRTKILEQARQNGDGRTELRLALAILEAQDLTQDKQDQARDLLTRANLSNHYGVRITAQNLIVLMDQTYGEDRRQ